MMMAIAMSMLAAVSAVDSIKDDTGSVQSMLQEESPDVFLAKATLQQYLSRIVRKDWDGAKRLTHPKALSAISDLKKRVGSARHNLAPWDDRETQLKTFRFTEARQVSPGVVLVAVGEDNFHVEEHGMSTDDPAVYILFKGRGGFLIGDKKSDAQLADISDDSVRVGYPGWVDHQAAAQARRESSHGSKHR